MGYAAELVLIAATTGEEWWRTIRLHRGFLRKSLQHCLWVLIQPRQNLIVENGTFISDSLLVSSLSRRETTIVSPLCIAFATGWRFMIGINLS